MFRQKKVDSANFLSLVDAMIVSSVHIDSNETIANAQLCPALQKVSRTNSRHSRSQTPEIISAFSQARSITVSLFLCLLRPGTVRLNFEQIQQWGLIVSRELMWNLDRCASTKVTRGDVMCATLSRAVIAETQVTAG